MKPFQLSVDDQAVNTKELVFFFLSILIRPNLSKKKKKKKKKILAFQPKELKITEPILILKLSHGKESSPGL